MAWLTEWYPWVKAAHVMSMIAWMAGLFYLPRLFVYHVERGDQGYLSETLQIMERRLLQAIMTPAMVSTWLFGLMLVMTPGIVSWESAWVWIKAPGVLAMTGFHVWLAGQRRALLSGDCRVSGRGFRLMNEVPTLLMVAIVLAVVVKF